MPLPGQSFDTADRHNSVEPLPLFRPEAFASQQQKFYGEIILIRPFSLLLLSWFAIGITSAVLGFLLLGHYTERARVPGMIVVSPAGGANPSSENLEAYFFVPGRLIGQLHPGSQLALRCAACSAPFSQQTGTVLEVPNTPLGPAELSHLNLNQSGSAYRIPVYKIPIYRIKVSLPPQAAPLSQLNTSPQTGMSVEAEIPLGRKPLIRWFFERSES
ncbi:MAG TPA: hypothetical protein VKV30_07860 [Candidatus Angelobacter sp.]|nr:hypothetical protein [Candidatus Angelobacter sp.]